MRAKKILLKTGFLLFFFSLCNPLLSQTKRAFVVAIGDYAPLDGKGWKKISSVNDTTYIIPSLRNQGFEQKNIQVITDKNASIEGLREGLKLLISSLEKNDIVVIHISAHGAQIEDDNQDELDGLDESIVTYNAVSPRNSTNFEKDQLQYMRDDEFGEYIELIRKTLGKQGDVLVIMDNCHSGSGTRNVGEIVRGGEPALVSKKGNPKVSQKDASVFKEKSKSDADLASVVIISASRAEELNTEIIVGNKGVGSLSYATSKALEQMIPHVSYQGFFAQIQSTMNQFVPKQHPVLEGDGLDRSLFGGKYNIQPDFIEIKSIEDPTLIIVRAGTVSGLSETSRIAVYPAGTSDTTNAKVAAFGKVIWSDNFIAGIELDRELKKTQAFDYWVFIKSTHYPIKQVIVKVASDNSINSRAKNYESILQANPKVKMEGTPDLILRIGDKEDTLIDCLSGQIWQCFENESDYSAALNASIERYMQYQFLKSYSSINKNFPVTVRLIPYKNGQADTTLLARKLVNGVYEFQNGDSMVVSISNYSNRRIYFNIVDLQPDGIINPIFPKKSKNIISDELYIEPNTIDKVLTGYRIKLSPPYGDEIFKVFISKDKLDLEYICHTKKDSTRSFMTELEQVFKNSYSPTTRGDFGSKEGSVININFRIVQ